eukprot:s1136_g4.t1
MVTSAAAASIAMDAGTIADIGNGGVHTGQGAGDNWYNSAVHGQAAMEEEMHYVTCAGDKWYNRAVHGQAAMEEEMGYVVFGSLGVCYSAELGREFLAVPAQGDCASQNFASNMGTRYMYLSSAFGIQSYRSERSCFPLAAFEELQLEVVDVTTAKGDDSFTVSISPCRTYVRFVVDAEPRQSHCQNMARMTHGSFRVHDRHDPAHA